MKPIIGIVSNFDCNGEIKIQGSNVKAIENSGGEPIAIVTKAEDEVGLNVLEMCDGFLFQGGSYSSDYQYKVLEYAYKNKKPIIAICLGFQFLARYFFGPGSVDIIDNLNLNSDILHNGSFDEPNIKHNILISKDSYMYKIFGENYMVNSRHNKTVLVVEKPFIISAKAEDGIIEGMEFIDDENYIVATQFHPEDLEDMKHIFDRFIRRVELEKNREVVTK